MRIVVCGAGRVGHGIARRLAEENHDVVVIDSDPALVDAITTDLDVRGVVGHAAHPDVLQRADAGSADMIIAVTYSDEVNMVTCQVAHSLFDVATKIARIRSQPYLGRAWGNLFARDSIPIDVVISPELEVGDSVLQRLATPGAFLTGSFAEDKVKLLGVWVPEGSPLVATPLLQLRALFPDLDAAIIGISRGERVFAPEDQDAIYAGDRIYLIVVNSQVERMLDLLGRKERPGQRIIIAGGGNIGLYVAKLLEIQRTHSVRLIEMDMNAAENAAQQLKKTIVLRGDALDPEILDEAGVAEADTVIGLTNDDKTNLLLAAVSKQMGVSRALSLVNDPRLATLRTTVGVDVIVDPRAVTVSKILLRLRRGRVLGLQSLEQGAAEVIEGIVLDTSPLANADIAQLPEGVRAGAILRGDQVIIPFAETVIRSGDHLVLLCEKAAIRKVEPLFRVSLEFF